MPERIPDAEQKTAKEEFAIKLADLIIESSQHGWAAGMERVRNPQRPNFKELTYVRDEWSYRDSYTGYYTAPGSSVVYLKSQPVWYLSYGGEGQNPEHLDKAKQTFAFLRRALIQPEPALPIRGPKLYEEYEQAYRFGYNGNLFNAQWRESIREDNELTFSQEGNAGIVIPKGSDGSPIYPWDI